MVAPADGYVEISDSVIGPFTTFANPNPRVSATRTQFINAGNGIMLRGRLLDCSGSVWGSAFGELVIDGGSYSYVTVKRGGKIQLRNTIVSSLAMGEEIVDASVTIHRESRIGSIYDGRKGTQTIKVYGPNQVNYVAASVRPGLVEIVANG